MILVHLMSNIISLAIYPLGFSLLIMGAGMVLMALRRRVPGFFIVISGVFILYSFSTAAIAHLFIHHLEAQYPQLASYPQVSAIVLLGGAGELPVKPRIFPETNEFGDRVMHAARLFKKGFAPIIIPSGGYVPGQPTNTLSEARVNAMLLQELFGIDSSSIVLEEKASNTRDHGPLVANILRQRGLPLDIIVVSTAMHMPRAVKVFRKYGFVVHPAPTDFRAADGSFASFSQWLPSANALMETTTALHEYYGIAAYSILGWI